MIFFYHIYAHNYLYQGRVYYVLTSKGRDKRCNSKTQKRKEPLNL